MSMKLVGPRVGTIYGGHPLSKPFYEYISRPNLAVHKNVRINRVTANFK